MLASMGEPFTENELSDFVKHASEARPTGGESAKGGPLLDITRLVEILMPRLNARDEILKEASMTINSRDQSIDNTT